MYIHVHIQCTLVVRRPSTAVQFWQRVKPSKHTWKNCFSEMENIVLRASGLHTWVCVCMDVCVHACVRVCVCVCMRMMNEEIHTTLGIQI